MGTDTNCSVMCCSKDGSLRFWRELRDAWQEWMPTTVRNEPVPTTVRNEPVLRMCVRAVTCVSAPCHVRACVRVCPSDVLCRARVLADSGWSPVSSLAVFAHARNGHRLCCSLSGRRSIDSLLLHSFQGRSVMLPSAVLTLTVLPDGTLAVTTADCMVRLFR